MSEIAAPLPREAMRRARMRQIERLRVQQNLLDLQMRTLLTSLVVEDTLLGVQKFVADEIALHLNESPGTADRLVGDARVFCDFPAVMAQVVDSSWSMRHADAVLDEILDLGLSRAQQDEVVALVVSQHEARTPHQLRKATRAAVITIDPEAAARRFEKLRRDRTVGIDETANGGACFWANGTKSQVAMVMASIDALVGPAQPGETRTLSQRRFDAFMDLICGRAVPAPFQALVVVALATLEGESVPAEIPGVGLITAEEAREAIGRAELRRVVVDENGEIVDIDSRTHQPDLGATAPGPLLSNETEPELCDLVEDEPSDDDRAWLVAQTDAADAAAAAAGVAVPQAAAESGFEAALRQLLDAQALVPAGLPAPDLRFVRRGEAPGWPHGRDPGGGGSNGVPPDPLPDDQPEPEPPTFEDQQWLEAALQRATLVHPPPRPRAAREPRMPGTTPPVRPTWTHDGLQRALTRVLASKVDSSPLTSTAYSLPPRMARFVKLRDLTCTFPGCYKLAQVCQSDHIDPWPAGPTAPHNIACECTHHHQAKHACFRVTRNPITGAVSWTTPSGTTVNRGPRPLLRGW